MDNHFTHVDAAGNARMVDVGEKAVTHRTAVAVGRVTMSPECFAAVAEGRFVEWEEVYKGTCYGTLRSEVERIWQKGHVIVFDVDVLGGINLKRIFGQDACSVFIMPPSVEELRRRLEGRGTDSPEAIDRRVAKAEFELTKAPEFDHTVINDRLDDAVEETCAILDAFINR